MASVDDLLQALHATLTNDTQRAAFEQLKTAVTLDYKSTVHVVANPFTARYVQNVERQAAAADK